MSDVRLVHLYCPNNINSESAGLNVSAVCQMCDWFICLEAIAEVLDDAKRQKTLQSRQLHTKLSLLCNTRAGLVKRYRLSPVVDSNLAIFGKASVACHRIPMPPFIRGLMFLAVALVAGMSGSKTVARYSRSSGSSRLPQPSRHRQSTAHEMQKRGAACS